MAEKRVPRRSEASRNIFRADDGAWNLLAMSLVTVVTLSLMILVVSQMFDQGSIDTTAAPGIAPAQAVKLIPRPD